MKADFALARPLDRRTLLNWIALAAGGAGLGGCAPTTEEETTVAESRAVAQPFPGFPAPTFVDTNGIRMAVYEKGEGFPVVLCHGFPELAFSWRHQLGPLGEAGYHAIAPDQRGYGLTDSPAAVEAYSLEHLCADLVGLLDAKGIDKAVFVGHDWGGGVVWRMPLAHPDRVAGVVGVNTPMGRPPGDQPPVATLRRLRGDDNYVVAFQEPGVADEILGANTEKLFHRLMRRGRRTAEEFAKLPEDHPDRNFQLLRDLQESEGEPPGELFLTPEELAFFVDTFERTGFTGGINWYRNIDRNWEAARAADWSYEIDVPCLYIGAADDVVLPPSSADGMESFIADLEKQTIDDCGHWTQQEKPEELNRILIDWLDRRFGAA